MRKGNSLIAAAMGMALASGLPIDSAGSDFGWRMPSWRVSKPRFQKKSTGTHKQNRRKTLKAKP